MSAQIDTLELRRCVLAVSVLTDLDVVPAERGVVLDGAPPVDVSWAECAAALAGHPPGDSTGRVALARWLLRRRWLADAAADLLDRARPVGLPVGHALHPGPAFVRRPVLGGALDVGLGFVGLQPGRPDRVIIVDTTVLAAAGIDAAALWPAAVEYLECMGDMAADRFRRKGPAEVLRPMGDCDVVTLLGSAEFRAAVAGADGGLRPAIVPMRTRGWLEINRVDPAFGPAAAAATDPVDRGFPRPVLITAEEVVQVAPGGDMTIALSDPAPAEAWNRPVLFR